MTLEEAEESFKKLTDLKIRKKLVGNYSYQISLCRKNITIKIYDGVGCVELSKAAFKALQALEL